MGIFYNISTAGDDANGIKVIENPTKTLKALLFPRDRLFEFNQRAEAGQAGVYILYNSMDKNEQPHIYIGQTGVGITSRLLNHNRNMDFWNQALVFVEKGDFLNLNSTHAKIIESRLIRMAENCGAVVMENATGSNAPRVQESDLLAAKTWADEVVTITRLLGLAFFQNEKPVQQGLPRKGDDPLAEYKRLLAKIEGRKHQNRTPRPKGFEIDGLSFEFRTWRDGTISVCNVIANKVGMEKFKKVVLNADEFKHRTRCVFGPTEESMRSFSCVELADGLWLLVHFSGADHKRLTEQIVSLFPEVDFKWIS